MKYDDHIYEFESRKDLLSFLEEYNPNYTERMIKVISAFDDSKITNSFVENEPSKIDGHCFVGFYVFKENAAKYFFGITSESLAIYTESHYLTKDEMIKNFPELIYCINYL